MRREYDELSTEEQSAVRAEWAEQIDSKCRNLDLARKFSDAGRSYVELDEHGQLANRPAP
jgi:hypothetical protein